jgi:hypothetical protein
MTLSTTLSTTTIVILTLSKECHHSELRILYWYTECHYTKCRGAKCVAPINIKAELTHPRNHRHLPGWPLRLPVQLTPWMPEP